MNLVTAKELTNFEILSRVSIYYMKANSATNVEIFTVRGYVANAGLYLNMTTAMIAAETGMIATSISWKTALIRIFVTHKSVNSDGWGFVPMDAINVESSD